MQVQVTVYLEQMYDENPGKAIEGRFIFVAIDANMLPDLLRK